MSNKLEMPLEKFAEAVAKENERLQSQYDIAIGAIRVGVERIEQLTSGPGGIMEMKQTIADKEERIEKLETALEHTMECFLGAREALKECVIERDEARKAGGGKMTDDLVKRLRRADTCIFPTERDRCHCGEAADRIQKLEAVLRKYANCVCESNCDEKSGQVCQLWACRKALEGKEPLEWTENYGQGSEPWLNKE